MTSPVRHSLLVFASLFVAPWVLAQETRGTIAGRVQDSSGAVIPQTEITALHTATNTKAVTVSNEQGTFVLPYLLPGMYRISARLKGFKTFERDHVEVRINDRIQVDVTMQLGDVAEKLTVTAETPLLETANASVGQVIDQRRISDLPVIHSNPMLLLQLSPAVASVAGNMTFGDTRAGDNARLTEYTVAGTPASTHEVTLDGVSNTTTSGGTSAKQRTIAFVPPSDIVNEFKVETASFDASVANAPGGLVNISLKSGTNTLHGTARFFKINPGWNANDFFSNKFGRPKTYLKNDHWVLSASGPVYIPRVYDGRNRTFFLYGYERQKDDDPYAGGNFSVPTEKQRQGDFSDLLKLGSLYQIYDPSTARLEGGRVARSPFAGNIVPASRFSAVARKLMEYYPKPRNAGAADGTLNYPYPDLLEHYTNYSNTARLDHNITERHRIFGRVNIGSKAEFYRDQYDNLSTGVYGKFLSRGAGFDDVYTFTPNLILNVRYGFTRFLFPHTPQSAGMDLTTLGFPASLVSQLDRAGLSFPSISVSGISPSLGGEKPDAMHTNTHHLAGNVNWVKGSHSLKLGADYRVYQENYYRWGHAAPAFSFGTSWTRGPVDNSPTPSGGVGLGFASFLLGLPESGYVDRNASYAVQSPLLGLHVQDDWRVSRRLTINVGLRYEVEGAMSERFNRSARGIDPAAPNTLDAQVRANYAQSPLPELSASQFSVKGGLLFAGVNGQPHGLFSTGKKNFAPRFGFAYQLDPQTVVRGGYGIFFGYVGQQRGEKVKQYGFDQRTNFVPTVDEGLSFIATLDNPFASGLLTPVGASLGPNTFIGNAISFFNEHPATPYNQRWQLSVQRTVRSFLFDLGYIGNRGTRLELAQDLKPFDPQYLSRSPVRDQAAIDYWTSRLPNPFYPLLPGTGLAASVLSRDTILRMGAFPQFTSVSTTENSGYSWYHAMDARAEKRFSRGYTVQFAYTWSKLMEAMSRLNGQLSPLEEVISSADRTHRFTLSGIYEWPFGPGKRFSSSNPVVKRVIGGWQTQWIWISQSGAPLGFGNALLTGALSSTVIPGDQRSVERWFTNAPFNTNAAQQLSYNYRVLASRFGNIRGDGRHFWNLSAIKSTPIRERLNLQLRAELFNAFNTPNFAAPNTSPTSVSYGVVSGTTLNPRLVQLGLKLGW